MSFEMQLKRDGKWHSIGTKSGIYRYPDRESAERMLSICYPDQLRSERLGGEQEVRVVEVDHPANMEEHR